MNGRKVSVRSVASILKLRKCRLTTSHRGARAARLLLKTAKCFVRIATAARATYKKSSVCCTMRQAFFVACYAAHCRLSSLILKYLIAVLSDKPQVAVLLKHTKLQDIAQNSKKQPCIWYLDQMRGCCDILLHQGKYNHQKY